MNTFNKKLFILSLVCILLVLGYIGITSFIPQNKKKNDVTQQEELKKKKEVERQEQQVAEKKKREDVRKEHLVSLGVKAIIHTTVLEVKGQQLTVQEVYPYQDASGRIYPKKTFTLIPSKEASYSRREYVRDPEGYITGFNDEQGSLKEIKKNMFVSAMTADDPYGSEKLHAPVIIYFDEYSGQARPDKAQ